MKQVEYQLVKEISDTVTEEMGKTYMIRSCFFFGMVALEKVQVSGFNPKFVVSR